MTSSYFNNPSISNGQDVLLSSSPVSPTAASTQRPSALSNKLTSVLSASFADSDIRDALEALDARGVQNTAETRRQLRLDIQKEVIDCNGEIVKDFGKVAEVRKRPSLLTTYSNTLTATKANWRSHSEPQ
jgi:conserved oligomeric Golgi complex subunit 6